MTHPAQLWVDRPGEALLFYAAAFGATVLHCVGEGDDIVGQLEALGGGPFSFRTSVIDQSAAGDRGRHRPNNARGGRPGRGRPTGQSPRARTGNAPPVSEEHGWRLGRNQTRLRPGVGDRRDPGLGPPRQPSGRWRAS